MRRMLFTRREALELVRDPIRMVGRSGSVLLLFIMGYGISMDVEDLTFAVLDRDQTTTSQTTSSTSPDRGIHRAAAASRTTSDPERRMRSGRLGDRDPPAFRTRRARRPVQIGAWIDSADAGAGRNRARLRRGDAPAVADRAGVPRSGTTPADIRQRRDAVRYNPDVESLVAMVPAVIPLC